MSCHVCFQDIFVSATELMEVPFPEMAEMMGGPWNSILCLRKSLGPHTECLELTSPAAPFSWAQLSCHRCLRLMPAHNLFCLGNYVQSFRVYKIDECRIWSYMHVRCSVKLHSLKQMTPLPTRPCSPGGPPGRAWGERCCKQDLLYCWNFLAHPGLFIRPFCFLGCLVLRNSRWAWKQGLYGVLNWAAAS